jgi:hypothetical protein
MKFVVAVSLVFLVGCVAETDASPDSAPLGPVTITATKTLGEPVNPCQEWVAPFDTADAAANGCTAVEGPALHYEITCGAAVITVDVDADDDTRGLLYETDPSAFNGGNCSWHAQVTISRDER